MPEINLTPTASFLDIASQLNSNGGGVAASGDTKAIIPEAASTPLPARSWGTETECVAAAVLVHGLGAHSGWFEGLGRRLKVRRIFSLAYDQVGFGKRRQEQFVSQSQWFADLTTAYKYVKKVVGDKPVYILGNSMGAAVSLKVVADQTFVPAGLAMFSPGFDGHPEIFNLQYKIWALISAFRYPDREIELPYTPDMITRDETVRAWLFSDPDRRFSPTGRMLLELLKLSFALPKIKSVPCPLFMITSGIDNIVDGKVSQKIFERLQAPRKRSHVYKEAWHDLMFDPVLDDLADELLRWMTPSASGT